MADVIRASMGRALIGSVGPDLRRGLAEGLDDFGLVGGAPKAPVVAIFAELTSEWVQENRAALLDVLKKPTA